MHRKEISELVVRLDCGTNYETIYKHFSNGLKLYAIPKKRKIKTAAVVFNAGSCDTEFKLDGGIYSVPLGTAHFVEHRMFEQSYGSVSEKFTELGAESNAFTDSGKTVYYFRTAENFEKCLKLLLDFVQKPYFRNNELETEKKIIASEIKMYADDPAWQSYFAALSALYPNSPVSEEIAGSVESIQKINADTLYTFHKAFYTPENMTVVCAGNVDAERIIKITENGINTENSSMMRINRRYNAVGGTKKVVGSNNVPSYTAAFPANIGCGKIKAGFLYRILGDMLFSESSEAFAEMSGKGFCTEAPAVAYISENGGILTVSGWSKNPEETVKIISRALQNFVYGGRVDSRAFDRAVKRVLGEVMKALDDTHICITAQSEWNKERLTAPEIISMIKSIRERDIYYAAEKTENVCGTGICGK